MNKESLKESLELLDERNIKYYPLKEFTYDATSVDLSNFESFITFCEDNNVHVVFYENTDSDFDECQFLTPWNGILVGYIINEKGNLQNIDTSLSKKNWERSINTKGSLLYDIQKDYKKIITEIERISPENNENDKKVIQEIYTETVRKLDSISDDFIQQEDFLRNYERQLLKIKDEIKERFTYEKESLQNIDSSLSKNNWEKSINTKDSLLYDIQKDYKEIITEIERISPENNENEIKQIQEIYTETVKKLDSISDDFIQQEDYLRDYEKQLLKIKKEVKERTSKNTLVKNQVEHNFSIHASNESKRIEMENKIKALLDNKENLIKEINDYFEKHFSIRAGKKKIGYEVMREFIESRIPDIDDNSYDYWMLPSFVEIRKIYEAEKLNFEKHAENEYYDKLWENLNPCLEYFSNKNRVSKADIDLFFNEMDIKASVSDKEMFRSKVNNLLER
ncbi:MAG: hypothetical protein MJ174_10690 [Treponema sp.]|nr:hypothetical protein [Treponema sp.]